MEVKTGTVAGAGTEAAGDARKGELGLRLELELGLWLELELEVDPGPGAEVRAEAGGCTCWVPVACFLANLGGSLEV